MSYQGDFTTANTIYLFFNTFDSNDPSASVAIAAFVIADVEVFKDGSPTPRDNTTGYALLDTDGIDFSGDVGIGGISIDLSDDTDAGFFAAGSEYMVKIGPTTIDAAVINFVAGTFSIERAGGAIALLKGTNSLSDIEAKIDLAQLDLDTLTGSDGVTLATAQGNYAPNIVVPDAAGVAPTAAEIETEIWDALQSAHVIADSMGALATELALVKAETVLILADTDDIGIAGAGLTNLGASGNDWNTVVPATKAEMDTAHGLLATEAKQDIIDTNVDDIETAIALVPQSGGTTTWNATALAAIQTEADASLTSYAGPTKAEMDTAHGLLATEAKQDIIDTNVDDIETAIALVPQSGGTTSWNATALTAIKDQLLPKTNTTLDNIEFLFVAASDGRTPVTAASGTAVTRSIDGGAFGSGTGTLASRIFGNQ